MAGNKNLRQANKAKKDEFYTQLGDIEKEMRHYKEHFRGKVVFCNCDDPYESNFFKFFAMNFNFLGLKKLIATCYATSPIVYTQLSLFSDAAEEVIIKEGKKPYKIEITEVKDLNNDGAVDLSDVEYLLQNDRNVLTLLEGDGDFRSAESIELLMQADIVVTNPPFSLFREYVMQLEKYDKKFIIIGNKNAITYKEIFALIKKNRLFVGHRNINSDIWFIVPDDYAHEKVVDGVRVKHIMACWFTNLKIKKHSEELIAHRQYNEAEYPQYANYNAININKIIDIPYDYDGCMGVPITFLDKYNPQQFEIIGLGISNSGIEMGVQPYTEEHKKFRKEVQKKGAVDGDLYMLDEDGHPLVPYARIIIKKRGGKDENRITGDCH